MKTTTQIYCHPYMWNVDIEWGSMEEMIAKGTKAFNFKDSGILNLGGSFNKEMNGTSRSALIQLAVMIDEDNNTIKGIRRYPWEGELAFTDMFNEGLAKGLYPVSIDWDGKTYIRRAVCKDGKFQDYTYELTDTYRY